MIFPPLLPLFGQTALAHGRLVVYGISTGFQIPNINMLTILILEPVIR